MTVIQVTRERTNAFRLHQQGLSPKRPELEESLAGTGYLPTREAAYLSAAARVEGFQRADLDRLVFGRSSMVEVAASGGRSFLVPAAIAPALIRCPAPDERRAAEAKLATVRASMAVSVMLKDAVLDTVADSGLGIRDLKEHFKRGTDEVSGWLRRPGILPAILTILRQDGELVRTVLSPPLDGGEVVFARTDTLLPGVNVPALEPVDALEMLCAWYFRVHGPAGRADFGWWAGTGVDEAQVAFDAIRPSLAPIRIEGVPYELYMTPAALAELMGFESLLPDPVHLVPWQDCWLMSHETRAGRFGSREAIRRLCPGPALPAILVSGEVRGRWTLDAPAGAVELDWFAPPRQKIRERAEAVAMDLGAFVKREMPNIAPLTLPSVEGEFPVYGPV